MTIGTYSENVAAIFLGAHPNHASAFGAGGVLPLVCLQDAISG
jgi:hypothetical protein